MAYSKIGLSSLWQSAKISRILERKGGAGMRCIYCDRSLGILRFRITEPFCSPEHRRLYYRKSDPPLAKLVGTNPQLIDRLTEPAIEEWIPATPAHGEAALSQTLRYPEVAASGPLITPLQILTDVGPVTRRVRPAPVEFSTVVYVVPPGDEELTPSELRGRILESSEYTATLRFTLNGSARTCATPSDGLAGMYGPEFAKVAAACPASPHLYERLSCGRESVLATDLPVHPVDMVGSSGSLAALTALCHRTAPVYSTKHLAAPEPRFSPGREYSIEAVHSKIDAPLVSERNAFASVNLPGVGNPANGLPVSGGVTLDEHNLDSKSDPWTAKLAPVRIPVNSQLILDSPGDALADSCKPKCSLSIHFEDEPHCFHPIELMGVNPLQARSAAVFAAVFPRLQQPGPLQKTPQGAEHLT